jgi:predicted HicB family RNase H-like nuclease
MKKTDFIEYKGYHGSVHFDVETETFYGKVEFIRDLVNYEATDAKSLIKAFQHSVEDYLADCITLGKNPDAPFKGSFNVRLTQELHREASLYALHHHDTLNGVIKKALRQFLAGSL